MIPLLLLIITATSVQAVPEYATCKATGDPHYTTFDGVYLDNYYSWPDLAHAHSNGRYLLVGTCAKEVPIPLKVWLLTGSAGMVTGVNVVFLKGGVLFNIKIASGQPASMTCNIGGTFYGNAGACGTAAQNQGVSITSGGSFVITATENNVIQFTVKVTGNSWFNVEVTARSDYSNRVIGYCGNYNGNQVDDTTCPSSNLAFKDCWKAGSPLLGGIINDPTWLWRCPKFHWLTHREERKMKGAADRGNRGVMAEQRHEFKRAAKLCRPLTQRSFRGCVESKRKKDVAEACAVDEVFAGIGCEFMKTLALECRKKVALRC